SALTALIACGMDIPTAAKEAQEYTYQTLKHAFRPGMGQFIPDRMFWARGNNGNAAEGESEAEAPEEPKAD
ncbi:MAG: bifunctional hydroxymethylpyrimidine kinase/phosphomethylpyrimidine kinase, partial [Burkholderiales bacterium]|nr:bifunctional hydroxymethylpyrimidine kinase/phosphomethylpyrimidine kinase [Burkholderiales bacterium]